MCYFLKECLKMVLLVPSYLKPTSLSIRMGGDSLSTSGNLENQLVNLESVGETIITSIFERLKKEAVSCESSRCH